MGELTLHRKGPTAMGRHSKAPVRHRRKPTRVDLPRRSLGGAIAVLLCAGILVACSSVHSPSSAATQETAKGGNWPVEVIPLPGGFDARCPG
jgi:hypothetical protein